MLFQYVVLFAFLAALHNVNGVKIRDNCVCGIGNEEDIDVRIINGSPINPHAYPWLVYITSNGNFYCGGSLINDRYVLTASHCLWGVDTANIEVHLGFHEKTLQFGDGISIPAKYVLMHENYTRFREYDNQDIGLIRLKTPVQFSKNILPICLPHPDSTYNRAAAIIAGWGTMDESIRKSSNTLLQGTVRIIDDDRCANHPNLKNKFVKGDMMCAYAHNVDTCQGDSGGPILYEIDTYHYELIGIVSWGLGCAPDKTPGVYARVTSYVDWIAKHTQDAEYCSVKIT